MFNACNIRFPERFSFCLRVIYIQPFRLGHVILHVLKMRKEGDDAKITNLRVVVCETETPFK